MSVQSAALSPESWPYKAELSAGDKIDTLNLCHTNDFSNDCDAKHF